MTNIFDLILQNIDKITAIVIALAALITTIVIQYKKIMELLTAEKLKQAAAPLIAIAEERPLSLLNELVNKPALSQLEAQSNSGKQNIVAQALIEREPKLLKKLKLKDIVQVGSFVNSIYQNIAKPIIKGLRH